jgi:hypothetical protein
MIQKLVNFPNTSEVEENYLLGRIENTYKQTPHYTADFNLALVYKPPGFICMTFISITADIQCPTEFRVFCGRVPYQTSTPKATANSHKIWLKSNESSS